jgi:hypothetical protein
MLFHNYHFDTFARDLFNIYPLGSGPLSEAERRYECPQILNGESTHLKEKAMQGDLIASWVNGQKDTKKEDAEKAAVMEEVRMDCSRHFILPGRFVRFMYISPSHSSPISPHHRLSAWERLPSKAVKMSFTCVSRSKAVDIHTYTY